MAVTLAPGLSRKLKKVLESRTDSPDLLASLNTLSTFYTDNAHHSRKNLRSTIEKRALSINYEFLQASQSAQQALDRVEEEVNALAESCDKIAKALSSCSSSTGDIISTTERLKQELDVTTQRQEIVSLFLRDYQLSNEEIKALREEDLNEDFFKALSHVQEIHANCKILLRTHHQVANMRHNALFRRFISALTRGGPGGMPRPIEVHAHDPLRYVGDMLGWLHQALASERELVLILLDPDAVTDTGPTARRFSKNVEIEHAKIESDITFVLDRIFEGVCRPFKARVEQVLQSQPSLIVAYKLSNTLEFYSYTISDLLGKETALCNTLRILKDAAQQTFFDILKTRGDKLLRYPPLVAVDLSPPLAVSEGVSVLLEIIDTYNSLMVPASVKKLDFEPVISALLDPIVQAVSSRIDCDFKSQSPFVFKSSTQILTPLQMCEQAAEAHRSKAVQSLRRSRASSDSSQFTRDSSSSVDALLNNSSSIPSSQSNDMPSKIFLINCLSAIQQPLLGHDVAAEYVKNLRSMIEKNVNLLVEKEVASILRKCGLLNRISQIRNLVNKEDSDASTKLPLAEVEGMSPVSLSDCLRAFFGLVLGSEGSLPEFEQMQVPQLRSEACIRAARSLAEAYELVYNAIMDPENGYPDPKSLARHPPDQIRTILGI
ncbi:hypothetical protein IFM89_036294 [Coptis chinensis]|uniref:Conserved Oligomeric Golgi complex subunit 6 C-terminal domain-containing protein n=1 Tax=Coptis chinensis TaxID=261450 RepID=A0A835IIU9_9MAGN|nr:hypothetical protein IFM89_036294 [Coptis chinensis]